MTSLFIPELKAEVSLLLHNTCDRSLLLEKWLVLVWDVVKRSVVEVRAMMKRRILAR